MVYESEILRSKQTQKMQSDEIKFHRNTLNCNLIKRRISEHIGE